MSRAAAQEHIVIDDDAGGVQVELQGATLWRVVDDVADEVHGATEGWLGAERTMRLIEAAVSEHANVEGGAVGFDAIVVDVPDVVVVDVDRYRQPIANRIGRPIGAAVRRMVDAVVKIRAEFTPLHGRFVYLYCVLGEKRRGKLWKLLPGAADPPHEDFRIVPSEEDVIGDIIVLRARPVGQHSLSDILEAAVLHGQSARADDVLSSRREWQDRCFEWCRP